MFKDAQQLYSGVFDSSIMRQNMQKSADRVVQCYEVELFHTDSGVSYVDKGRYPIRRGMLLCAKPGQIRHSEFPVRCSFLRVHPAEQDDPTLLSLLSSLPTCTYLEDTDQIDELLELFSKLSARLIGTAPEPLDTLRINAAFLELLYRTARLTAGGTPTVSPSLKSSSNRIARQAYEYINEHYTEDCSLGRLAGAVRSSPNHLHTVFCREIGMSPLAYVTKKRIEQAKKQIMAGERTMLEIALDCGFCSQSHFNKVFREQIGLTPVEYRKKLLERY